MSARARPRSPRCRSTCPSESLSLSSSSLSVLSSHAVAAAALATAGALLLTAIVALPPMPSADAAATAVVGPGGKTVPRLAARVMRIGGTTSSSSSSGTTNNNNNVNNQDANNYSVSFVPLFSLIANFLPRLLARFAIKPPGSRSLNQNHEKIDFLQNKGIYCDPEHTGRWPDITNCNQFYECEVKLDSPPGCQMFLSHNKNKENTIKNDNKIKNFSQNQALPPELIDQYHTSCVTVSTYKCPQGYIYDDKIQSCDINNGKNKCEK